MSDFSEWQAAFKTCCIQWDQKVAEILQSAQSTVFAEKSVEDVVFDFSMHAEESNRPISVQTAKTFLEAEKMANSEKILSSGDMETALAIHHANKQAEMLIVTKKTDKNTQQQQKKPTTLTTHTPHKLRTIGENDVMDTPTTRGMSKAFSTPKSSLVPQNSNEMSTMWDETPNTTPSSSFNASISGTSSFGGINRRTTAGGKGNGTTPLRSSAVRGATAGTRRGTRSPWTGLLSTPSHAIQEHDKKGQILVSLYAKNANQSKVTMFDDEEQEDDVGLDGNNTRKLKKTPIYILSHVLAELANRKMRAQDPLRSVIHRTRNPQHPAHAQSIAHIKPDGNPFKTTTPFRYMDFQNHDALNAAIERERTIGEEIIQAEAVAFALSNNNNNNGSEQEDIVLPEFVHDFTKPRVTPGLYVGHIKNIFGPREEDPLAPQILTQSTVILSNYRYEVPMLLTHRQIQQYSFFPGQIIVCRGTNVTGQHLMPDIIFTESTLEKYHRQRSLKQYWVYLYQAYLSRQKAAAAAAAASPQQQQPQQQTEAKRSILALNKTTAEIEKEKNNNNNNTQTNSTTNNNEQQQQIPTVEDMLQVETKKPVRVMYCNGPFVSPKNEIQAISTILDQIVAHPEQIPDVLILSGPFVDADSQLLQVTNQRQPVKYDPTIKTPQMKINGDNCALDNMMNGNITTTTATSTDNTNISLCDVPVFKTDMFNKLNTTQQFNTNNNNGTTAKNGLILDEEEDPALHADLASYHDLFTETLDHIITQLNRNPLTRDMTVITVPSPRDLHHFTCYPQPAYDYTYNPPASLQAFYNLNNNNTNNTNGGVRVMNAPNPAILDINGNIFGITTNDVLRDLSGAELASAIQRPMNNNNNNQTSTMMQNNNSSNGSSNNNSTNNNNNSNTSIPSSNNNSNNSSFDNTNINNTPHKPQSGSTLVQLTSSAIKHASSQHHQPRPAMMTKKTVRLVSHILSQQTFAPTTAINPDNLSPNVLLELQAQTQLSLPFKPDILLLPSKLRYFAEIVPMPGSLCSSLHVQDPSEEFLKEHGHVIAINPQSVVERENLGTYAMITLYNTPNTSPTSPQDEDIVDRATVEIVHL